MRSIAIVFFAVIALGADTASPPAANPNLKPVTIDNLSWTGDLATAIEQAAKDKKLIFIDFTGVTCTNCKINEKNVFVKPEVKDLFKNFVRVQLYTDVIPEEHYAKAPDEAKRESEAEANLKFQRDTFKTEQLPLYVIVKPVQGGKFEVVGTYDEGRINKLDKFIEFLKR